MYPESTARVIIYPADFVFYAIWSVAQWFVDDATRDKVKPMMYLYGVEEFIDRKHIPVSMVTQYARSKIFIFLVQYVSFNARMCFLYAMLPFICDYCTS